MERKAANALGRREDRSNGGRERVLPFFASLRLRRFEIENSPSPVNPRYARCWEILVPYAPVLGAGPPRMGRPTVTFDLKHETLRHLDLALAACELALARVNERHAASTAASGAFRHLHSAKAIAGLMENRSLPLLMHGAETAASLLRRKEEAEIRGQLRPWVEVLESVRSAVRSGRTSRASSAVKRFVERLSQAGQTTDPLRAPDLFSQVALDRDALDALTEYERHRLAANLRARVPVLEVKVRFPQSDFSAQIEELRNRLMAVGEVIAMLPLIEPVFGESISFRVILASRESDESLALLSPASPIAVRNLSRGGANSSSPGGRADKSSDPQNQLISESHVWLSRLSQPARLLELSTLLLADIHLLATRVEQAGHLSPRFRVFGARRIARLAKLLAASQRLTARKVAELAVASGVQTARELSRNVRFVISPAGVSVPKPLADSISVSLVHLVRNAVVHGTSENSRRAMRVEIGFAECKGRLDVTVSDDGKGIDAAQLREACDHAGVDLPANAPTSELLQQIFDDRLTLAAETSLIAGRGVGLAAVKRSVEEARGSVVVRSRSAKGTSFHLRFPKQQLVLSCLIVGWGDRLAAVPLVSLAAILAHPGELSIASNGVQSMKHRNRTVRILPGPALREDSVAAASSGPRALLIPEANRALAFDVRLIGIEREGEFSLAHARGTQRKEQIGMLTWQHRAIIPVIDFARFLTLRH